MVLVDTQIQIFHSRLKDFSQTKMGQIGSSNCHLKLRGHPDAKRLHVSFGLLKRFEKRLSVNKTTIKDKTYKTEHID